MTREELLTQRMQDITNEASDDFSLTDFNLKEKTLDSPNTKIKWVRILMEEQRLLTVLNDRMDQYKKELLEKKFNVDAPKFRVELDMEKDDGVAKIKHAIADQKDVVRLVEGIVKVAQGFGFDIKNCVDIVKLEQ